MEMSMKRILLTLAALLIAGTAYAASETVYRPKLTFTVDANPYSSTAATTAASAQIYVVRVLADEDTFINVGVSPTASASATGMLVVGDVPEYFAIGAGEQIAVLSRVTSGTIYITEMTQ